MKVLSIVLVLIVFIAVGCKTQKIAPKPKPVPVKSERAYSETTPSGTAVKPSGSVGTTTSGKLKEERLSAAKGEANDLGSKRFYIIVGSFGVYENAQNFKKQLLAEDFFPGILVNEAGLYRVCVNSYDDEQSARTKLGEIREKFTKYADSWLLIKKQ
jgi:cell division protein FtsN